MNGDYECLRFDMKYLLFFSNKNVLILQNKVLRLNFAYESYQNNDICQRYFAMIVYNAKESRFLSHFVFAIEPNLCTKN